MYTYSELYIYNISAIVVFIIVAIHFMIECNYIVLWNK